MPYSKFICPDKCEIPIEDCLKRCRLKGVINPSTGQLYCPADRCLSRRTLQAIAQQREWNGKPSTTQLLNGTREVYLMLTHDYAVDPQNFVFALNGTKVHANLEGNTDGNAITEMRLDDGVSTGAFDYFDEEASAKEGHGYLYDDKTYGSFKVANILGIYSVDVPTGTVYKTGAKKGKPKTRKEFRYDGAKDRLDLAIQLNDYRMKIEKCLGKTVDKMICEVLVRDGNTFMATGRGVTQPSYLVPINRISDRWVSRYMKYKADALLKALETKKMPPPCRYNETWGGRKCMGYCAVSQYCDHYAELIERGKV